jgi:IS5 family transposase
MTARLSAGGSNAAAWSTAWRERGGVNQPLEAWQRLMDAWLSRIRCGVERANATMKRWCGPSRVRYRALARNACHLPFVALALNMNRALALMEKA